jgi:DNA-binding transcriptional regulator YiaG
MIVLAWLCEDERVRAVAAQWSLLTSVEKQKVEIETLCLAVGVEPADFIRAVAAAAWELGIEFPLRLGIKDLRSYVRQFDYDLLSGRTIELFPASLLYAPDDVHWRQNKRLSSGKRVRSTEDHAACDTFAANRREWRLSKTQFADLFLTTRRTVTRWEDRLYSPTPHQRWLMERFLEYIKTNGRRAFPRRFVRHTVRYQRSARALETKISACEGRPPTAAWASGNEPAPRAGGLQP